MTAGPSERLVRLLGDEDLRWVVDRARTRLEAGRPLSGVVTLSNATERQRSAIAGLLGRAVGSGTSVSVSLDAIDQTLQRSGIGSKGLASAIIELTGPVVVRRDAADEASRSWLRVYQPLVLLASERPEFGPWVDEVASRGIVKRQTRDPDAAELIVESVAAVLAALPSPGESLPRFAARVLGDAHALDAGTATSSVVLGALRSTMDLPPSTTITSPVRRELWGRMGVAVDELSSTVLVHALPSSGHGAVGGALELLRSAGHPVVLTLRQLMRENPVDLDLSATVVSICENPAVIAAAADELGADSAPLVCVNGQPSVAAVRLLGFLADAGAALRYHGDFDWGGLQIANSLWRRLPIVPWRFSTSDYEGAAAASSLALIGRPVTADWDVNLGDAMRRNGHRVEEEQVLPQLVADLK